MSGLLAISLGYNDPDVNAAVQAQLEEVRMLPVATSDRDGGGRTGRRARPVRRLVRFGKNGSDATAGAVRVARAYTGRDRVAVCGYHGWQDWYIGSTSRDLGVPAATKALTHPFRYNDVGSLEALLDAYPGGVRRGDPRADEHHLAGRRIPPRRGGRDPGGMVRCLCSTRRSPGSATRWAVDRNCSA